MTRWRRSDDWAWRCRVINCKQRPLLSVESLESEYIDTVCFDHLTEYFLNFVLGHKQESYLVKPIRKADMPITNVEERAKTLNGPDGTVQHLLGGDVNVRLVTTT